MSCLMINDLDAGVGRFGKSFIELFLRIIVNYVYLYVFSSRAYVLGSCVHFIRCTKQSFCKN
jgi:hypothetical protein